MKKLLLVLVLILIASVTTYGNIDKNKNKKRTYKCSQIGKSKIKKVSWKQPKKQIQLVILYDTVTTTTVYPRYISSK